MISKKQFFMSVVGLVLIALCLGVVLPFLVSAKSTFAFIFAVVLMVAAIGSVFYYVLFKKEIK